MAWNSIVQNKEQHMDRWQEMIEAGDPLSRLRAKQMIELVSEGEIVKSIPELTHMVLESMVVNQDTITVSLLDGELLTVAV